LQPFKVKRISALHPHLPRLVGLQEIRAGGKDSLSGSKAMNSLERALKEQLETLEL
jgi:hypothetical protein